MSASEIKPHVKKELEREEVIAAGRHYAPYTDVFETPDALTLVMDMPGVATDQVEITLDKDRLTVGGQIDQTPYDGLRPLYTEYNVGHFTRTFSLARRIDQAGITAEMKDGVLTLRLPVSEQDKPRQIKVT